MQTCRDDLDHWTALMNPPSVHTASHTLVEMAMNLPSEDRELFTPLGDHGVCMPLRLMEKYLYPTIKLMHFLEERRTNQHPWQFTRRDRGYGTLLVLPSGASLP